MGAISGEEAIAIANQYTNESLAGAGAVAGVPCQIQSITDITGGHRVTFLWVDNNGDSHTSSMDVLNGVDGQDGRDGADGKGIKAVTINEEGHLIITYSDDTTSDAGKIEIQSAVDSVNGKTGAVTLDASDVGALPDNTAIPTKTSDLTNDSGFITKAVNDLVNYYLKSETYSKTEVDNIITAVKNSRFEVVATLPTTDIKTNVIYLVPKSPSQTSNVKDEYINLDGTTSGWEKIGDTEIDLSDYVTTQALNTALAAYTTTADLTTLLAAKQDTLTFDNVPTENSNNPVKSGGVYIADDKIYQVMGQNSAKNFIPFDLDRIKANNTRGTWNDNVYSLNGIDFTFNSDGTVNASGTATETASLHYYDPNGLPPFGGNRILKLTGCPSGGGSGTTYKLMAYRAGAVDGSTGTAEDYGDGIILTWLNNGSGIKAFISISVYTGAGTVDVTFKPMLRLATDTDNTFAPYAKTNQELTAETKDISNVYGSKNLLRQVNNGDVSAQGITFSPNDDGSVTLSGTNTSSNASYYYISKGANLIAGDYEGAGFWLPKGNYIVSGGVETQNGDLQVIDITEHTTTSIVGAVVGDTPFTLTDDTLVAVRIRVNSNKTASGTVYPMIRLASITDGTYEPYAMTNRQLTEDSVTWDDLSEVGAVNYCKNKATTGTTTDGTTTFTWTVNEDKSVTVSAPSYPVTLASNQNLVIWNPVSAKENKELVNKVWRLTGAPSNGCIIELFRVGSADGSGGTLYDTGEGLVFTWLNNGSGNYNVAITLGVRSGNTLTEAITFKPMIAPVSYNGPYVPYAETNRELTDDVIVLQNGAGLPKKTLIRTLENGKITVTIPKNLGSSYVQGSLKLIGSNADSEAHVTFCLNADNTAVTVSKLTNLGSKALTLDSASISGNNLVLEISGVQNYAWVSAEYFMSLSAGANAIQPTWTFIGS